jgi:hypothetical protein
MVKLSKLLLHPILTESTDPSHHQTTRFFRGLQSQSSFTSIPTKPVSTLRPRLSIDLLEDTQIYQKNLSLRPNPFALRRARCTSNQPQPACRRNPGDITLLCQPRLELRRLLERLEVCKYLFPNLE